MLVMKRPAGAPDARRCALFLAQAEWERHLKQKGVARECSKTLDKAEFFRERGVAVDSVRSLDVEILRLKPFKGQLANAERDRRKAKRKTDAKVRKIKLVPRMQPLVLKGTAMHSGVIEEMKLLMAVMRLRDDNAGKALADTLVEEAIAVVTQARPAGEQQALLARAKKLWTKACQRWSLTAAHSDCYDTFFTLSQLDRKYRETYSFIRKHLAPWIIKNNVPLGYVFWILLVMRYFHSVIFRSRLWPVNAQSNWFTRRWDMKTNTLAPLTDSIADFERHYDDCIVAGECKTATFGPGRIVLIRFEGMHFKLREGALLHLQHLEGLAATMQSIIVTEGPGLFSSAMAAPGRVPARIYQLFTSSFASNVGEYYCKHTQGEYASLISACSDEAGEKWGAWCATVWGIPASHAEALAEEMLKQVVVGPGPQSLIDNYLCVKSHCTDQEEYLEVVQNLRLHFQKSVQRPRGPIDRLLSNAFGDAPFLGNFDFQCFLCMAKEGLYTWEEMQRQLARLSCEWKIA
jgi:hypothetical protein